MGSELEHAPEDSPGGETVIGAIIYHRKPTVAGVEVLRERQRGGGRFLPCTYTAIDNHGPLVLIFVISNDSPLPPALSWGRFRVHERTPQTLNVLLRPPPCAVMVHPFLSLSPSPPQRQPADESPRNRGPASAKEHR